MTEKAHRVDKGRYPNWADYVTWAVGGPAALAAAVSLWFAKFGFGDNFDVDDRVKITQAVVLTAWIVLPPLWFWLEYFWVYPKRTYYRPKLEKFKYGQDVSSKIWLALITALLGLYFGKDLHLQ